MVQSRQIIVIVLGVINALLIAPIIISISQDKLYKYLFDNSRIKASEFGYIISLVAGIRTGKSSLQSGLKHIFELELQDKILDIFNLIKIILNKIDFNKLNDYLDKNILSYNDFDKLTSELMEELKISDVFIFDYLTFKKTSELIYSYVYCYYVYYFRNNYVMSKTKIYSQVTGNFNLYYDVDNQKINEAYLNKSYDIEDYMIELLDELTDEFGASKRYYDMKEEDGAKEYRRKLGHLHQETNRIITTKQDASDEIKKYRTLNNTEVEILKKVKLIGNKKRIQDTLDLFIKICYFLRNIRVFFNWLFKKKLRKDIGFFDYLDKLKNINSFTKQLERKVYFFKKLLDSKGYCKFPTRVFTSNKDIESSSNYHKITFIIPAMYCFGTYNNFEFNFIQKDLLTQSKAYSVEVLRYEQEHFTGLLNQEKEANYEYKTF